MSAPAILLRALTKRFGARAVLDGLDLAVPPGSCLGLLGASGSGKTTALRLIAGLERADAGAITLGEREADDGRVFVPPDQRGVGLVFQDLALWPHLTAAQHLDLVAHPLGLARAERRARVAEWIARCRLAGHERKRPDQLSGGERQRLALARTLLPAPGILLLDEPFAGCDRPLVADLKALVAELHGALGLTVLLVSHDWRDMEGLVEKLAVLDAGRLIAEGAPAEVRRALHGLPAVRFFEG